MLPKKPGEVQVCLVYSQKEVREHDQECQVGAMAVKANFLVGDKNDVSQSMA